MVPDQAEVDAAAAEMAVVLREAGGEVVEGELPAWDGRSPRRGGIPPLIRRIRSRPLAAMFALRVQFDRVLRAALAAHHARR
jgi:hypothetical protein